MAETALERAERQLAQAKARLQSLRNREAAAERKLDTRRKVILGGALMDLAQRDDVAAAMLDRLIRNLTRDQDRKPFVGWSASGSPEDDCTSDAVTGEGQAGSTDGAASYGGMSRTDG